MKTKDNDPIRQNKIFAWLAAVTGLILMLPYLAMRYAWVVPDPGNPHDQGVNWTRSDFIVMGILIFGTGSLFILVARKINRKHRVPVAIAFALGFLWLWAELAVGIFTNWGS